VATATQIQFKIDGVVKEAIPRSAICWTSTGVQYTGETWDRGDQMGGTVGVHQVISSSLVYRSGSWTSPNFESACSTDYPAEYVCSKVSGQRVDIWSDRS
jgi:hypothetical protein